MRDIEDYSKKYKINSFEDYQVKYRRKKILEIIQSINPTSILEIGCGMQPLFQFLHDHFNNYTFVEPSKDFYDNAISLLDGRSNIYGINDFFSATEHLIEKKWDFIVCSSLLHEVEEPRKLLCEILKLCDKDTIVHINVPNAYSVHRIIAVEVGITCDVHDFSKRNIEYQQNTVFDVDSLKKLVRDVGFSVIDGRTYFVKPFTHSQMKAIIENKIIDEKVLDGLYGLGEIMQGYGSEIYVNLKREDMG